MTNPRTARELKHLEIDTKETQLPATQVGRRLRSRIIGANKPPPVPPPRSSSVPADQSHVQSPSTVTKSRINQRDPTPLPRSFLERNQGSSGALDTTDVESISQTLQFASEQLRERHRVMSDTHGDTTPEVTSPTPSRPVPQKRVGLVGRTRDETPSSDGDYMTPQRPPPEDPPNTVFEPSLFEQEQDVDDQPAMNSQRPDVMIGEAYFDFRDNQYRLLHNRQTVSPSCVMYHAGRDRCYYYGTNSQWKAADVNSFPDHTNYVLYRSGNMQTPAWGQRSHSLMTPSPTPASPHVSFPTSAFQPVQPGTTSSNKQYVSQPTPIRPPTRHNNPFYNPHPLNLSTFEPVPSSSPNVPRSTWPHTVGEPHFSPQMPYPHYNPYQHHISNYPTPISPHATQHFHSTSLNPFAMTREDETARQLEIDRQVALRLQQMELAKSRQEDPVTMITKQQEQRTIPTSVEPTRANDGAQPQRPEKSQVTIETQTETKPSASVQQEDHGIQVNPTDDDRTERAPNVQGRMYQETPQ